MDSLITNETDVSTGNKGTKKQLHLNLKYFGLMSQWTVTLTP